MDIKQIINETFSRFIKEGATPSLENLIFQAIDKAVRVTFDYPSSKSGGLEKRDAYIYNYGETAKGKPAVRVYQINGSGSGSKWKLFALENMSNLQLHPRFKIRTLPADIPSFRTDGDKGLPTIFAMLDVDKIKGISSVKTPQKPVNKNPQQQEPQQQQEPKQNPNPQDQGNNDNNNEKIPTM